MAEKTCNDRKCPKHGTLKVHGRIFKGIVTSTRPQKTAIVEFERWAKVPKYERYEKRRTKLKAYNPLCMDAKEGDIVQAQECRPLSKLKSFVITKKLGKEELFEEIAARKAEAKISTKKPAEKTEKTMKKAEPAEEAQ